MSELLTFQDAIRAAGLNPPDVIEPGKFHKFPGEGKTGRNTAAWCKLFPDGLGGIFGDYSSGLSDSWQSKRTTPYSVTEREAFKRQIAEAKAQAETEKLREQAEARERATLILAEAVPCSTHAYLTRKGIQAHGVKLSRDRLVIPIRDTSGTLHSLQFIDADGGKKYLTGGRIKGGYFGIGKPDGVLCIAEGFATGASIHKATGHAVAVAFDAGNLLPVAQALRAKFPRLRLILCADDDYRTAGNPGLTKATEAAQAVGGVVAIPKFGDSRPDGATDFNDLAQHCGQEAIKRATAAAIDSTDAVPSNAPNSPAAIEYDRVVELVRGSDVTPESVSWLWSGWLAAGKLHVLGGAPGTGKTTISMALAATVTTGGRWPDGTRCTAGNVVIWSGEDNFADTLVPRLALSGADLDRVYFIADVFDADGRRAFDPAKDMEPLRRKLETIGDVRLLIVDPIVSAVSGDSHKNAEVRRSLAPLVDLAGAMRCALVGITHFSKGTGGRDPVERLTGSLAFGALARVVLVAAKHQEEGEDGQTKRLFCRAKSNIGPDDGGFEYDLQQGEVNGYPGLYASAVAWGQAVEGEARELLATADSTGDDGEGGTLADAKRFLTDLLADGSVPTKAIKGDADGAGFSWRTIQRAQKALGIHAHKEGMKGGWVWSLSVTKNANKREDCQQNLLATFGKSGVLRTPDEGIEVEL